MTFSESIVEEAALCWLIMQGFSALYGPDFAVGMPAAERAELYLGDVVPEGRLRQALERLNSELPFEALADALRKVVRVEAATLVERARAVHRMLVDGVPVEHRRPDGSIAGAQVRVIEFERPENNDWVAVNQFAVVEGQYEQRPDIVIFVNGLPLAVIELKNSADEKTTVWSAYKQLQTYQTQIPALFAYNVCMVASGGAEARGGALGARKEWLEPWPTIDGGGAGLSMAPGLRAQVEGPAS